MKRKIEQWRNCNPLAMAQGMSEAAQLFAFEDAKSDILELFAEVERLTFENERLKSTIAGQSEAIDKAIEAGIDRIQDLDNLDTTKA